MAFKIGDKVRGKDPTGKIQNGVIGKVDYAGPGSGSVWVDWADGSGSSMNESNLAALAPVSAQAGTMQTAANNPGLAQMKSDVEAAMQSSMASVIGGIVGAVIWKDHRYIGFFSGASAASAAMALKNKRYAAAVGDAAAGSLSAYLSLRNPKHPAISYAGGHMLGKFAGSMLASLVLPKSEKK